jgi:thioredoxin-related protein
MKKIFIALFLTLSSLYAEVTWLEYNQALQKAQAENKIIMVMLGRSTCGVCNYMKSVVFHDKNVIEKLEPKFLAAYIELDFDEIPNNLTYIGTPTFHFLDKEEKALGRIDGGKTIPSFLKALESIN